MDTPTVTIGRPGGPEGGYGPRPIKVNGKATKLRCCLHLNGAWQVWEHGRESDTTEYAKSQADVRVKVVERFGHAWKEVD